MRISAGFSWMLLAMAALLSATASANPTGPQVVSGTATLQQPGSLLQITNTPNAIINWQSFSIGVNEITRFVQQSASSAVLNRVVTQNPSSILGALQSNGRVFLINPNGIVFGAGAQIDVAGLVASTLNLFDQDFLAGRMRFTETPGAGAVVNQGAISAGVGGVYLVGSSVTNGGVITAPRGEVILAAGKSVELVDPGTPNLRVEISAPDNEALNLGQILASSGRIGIFGGLIRSSGTLNADRAVAGPAGEILLRATTNVVLDGGAISATEGIISIEGTAITIAAPVTVNAAMATIASPINGTGSIGVGTPTNGSVVAQPAAGTLCLSATPQSCPVVGSLTVNSTSGELIIGSVAGNLTVSSAAGVMTITSASVPAGSVQPGSVASNASAIAVAFDNAARVLHLGTGQVVGSLLATSHINDIPKTLDGSAFGRPPAPESSPGFD